MPGKKNCGEEGFVWAPGLREQSTLVEKAGRAGGVSSRGILTQEAESQMLYGSHFLSYTQARTTIHDWGLF